MKKIILLIAFCILISNICFASVEKNEILNKIKTYQKEYFTLIQRNDILFGGKNNYEAEARDNKKLEEFFLELENKMDLKNPFAKKYNKIKNKYKDKYLNVTIAESTPILFNESEEYDKLLNKIYFTIKKDIPADDFEKLKQDERLWSENVDSYYENIDKISGYAIRTDAYFDYLINARKFRILLLMFYFQ